MGSMSRRVLGCAWVIAGLSVNLAAQGATSAQLDAARASGLAWLYQHQQGDGSWSAVPGLEVQSTSAVVDALLNAGVNYGNTYNAAVARLASAKPGSTDSLARQVSSLNRAGNDVSQQSTQLQSARNIYLAWGALPGYGTSVADTSLALSAMLDAVPGYANNDLLTALCNTTLPGQSASGGWPYLVKGGNAPVNAANPSIIPTAYTILLLQKVNTTRFTGVTCGGTPYTFSTVINNAINYLLTQKNPDNGFGENGVSGALETALAYRAIQAVNPANTALAPAQDYLVNTQVNGAWANDPFQTALALQTLPPTTLADTAKDGIPDTVKTILGITSVAAGRNLRPGNGLGVPGLTAPLLVAAATVNQAYGYTLSASGGSAPYVFRIAGGSLPGGLTLASNGQISGTPNTLGAFNFTYEVTDSLNAVTDVSGQIQVNAPTAIADADVPTLPQWGAILLGALFMASMLGANRRRKPGS